MMRVVMQYVLIVFTLTLFVQRIYASGPDVVNCAGCFAQNWNWASWQCDVHCDVETSKYGQVDGFTAAAVKPAGDDRLPVTVGQTFIWGKVLVNIQGGYDVTTGIFTVTIPGIYDISLKIFSGASPDLKMYIMLERDENTSRIGSALAGASKSTSTSIMYELEVGDKLYAHVTASPGSELLIQTDQETSNVFRAHLLYKSLV